MLFGGENKINLVSESIKEWEKNNFD